MKRISDIALAALALALPACGPTPSIPEVRIETVPVPVAVPCVVNRPGLPATLKQQYPADKWAAMPTGAKAQAVAAQAGERLNYEGRLEAATAGCK